MPRVSAEADSVSAMRMTRSAMGTVRISRYDGSARSFCHGVTNAPRVADGLSRSSFMSPRRQTACRKKRKITASDHNEPVFRQVQITQRTPGYGMALHSRPISVRMEMPTATAYRGNSTSIEAKITVPRQHGVSRPRHPKAQITQRRQGTAGFIPPNQRPHGNANGNDTREQHQHKGKHRARQQSVMPPTAAQSSSRLPAPFRAIRQLRSARSVPHIQA